MQSNLKMTYEVVLKTQTTISCTIEKVHINSFTYYIFQVQTTIARSTMTAMIAIHSICFNFPFSFNKSQ